MSKPRTALFAEVKRRWERYAWVAVPATLAVMFATIGWINSFHRADPLPPVNLTVPAMPAPEVRGVDKEPIALKVPVRAYKGGAKIKKGLRLPEGVVVDAAKVVLASSQIRADDHPQTVTSTLNTETGETETFVKRDPLPWVAWDSQGEIGMYAGVKNGVPAVRLEGKQGVFQAKALHFGVVGSIDQPLIGPVQPDYFVGAGAWMRW